jgi:SPP1 gp7 family putative phage head morphogenesis protein
MPPLPRTGRVSTRIRRTSHRQGPRAPLWLVERMVVAAVLLVTAYTDRLMRALRPLLEARYGKRHDSLVHDAISIPPEVFGAAVDPDHVPTLAEIFRLLDDIAQAPMSRQFLERMFKLVDNQALDDLQRVVPITLAEVLPGANEMREAWIDRNTSLIRLEERAQQEVRAIIEAPIVEGVRVEEITALIQERMGVVRSRAELIARDQTLKVYGSIQEARQTEAGIVEYTWSTSLDERVRHRHSELEGTTQRWDSPPVVDPRTGRRGHPGSGDYNCRCCALPILPTGDDELAPDSETRPSVRFAARAAENDT